jgi:pimeloyl-ACP methyl ester carboxylesterase
MRAAAMYHALRARPSETWAAIAAAGIPTLLLLATVPDETRDRNVEARVAFAAAVPQADVVLVDGASHSMITDLRERFGSLVADWLARSLA